MKMCDCPKYEGCSAPLCPLDADWTRRVYRKGEPICFYLLEYVKPDARARFKGCIAAQLYPVIAEWVDVAFGRYAPLRRALERAKRTGSRMIKANTGAVVLSDAGATGEERIERVASASSGMKSVDPHTAVRV